MTDKNEYIGITVNGKGLGDTVQFSSVPENYYHAFGKRLVDVERAWIFDHNPYVIRDDSIKPAYVREMWNFSPRKYDWPVPGEGRPRVYLSNAELHALVWGIQYPILNRPRLYVYENVPFHKREKILLHIDGRSHGELPDCIVDHLIQKYKPTGQLYHIGLTKRDLGIPKIETPTFWDLVKVISHARMLIGSDSGPSWIAACYPDIVIKKVRIRPRNERLETWTPLSVDNIHAHWDDRAFQLFCSSDHDVGAYQSYRKM